MADSAGRAAWFVRVGRAVDRWPSSRRGQLAFHIVNTVMFVLVGRSYDMPSWFLWPGTIFMVVGLTTFWWRTNPRRRPGLDDVDGAVPPRSGGVET